MGLKATKEHPFRLLKNPHTPWEGVKGAWTISRRTAGALRRAMAARPAGTDQPATAESALREVIQISDKMTEIRTAGFSGETAMPYKKIVKFLKLIGLFIFSAIALGFFASIGIWAAVSFLEFFGIETL